MADTNPIEEALNKIEVGIRQLKVQYDMFFAGAMPRQPFETRKELEILINTVGDLRMQRFADRYRYNSLASKYQTMVELWSKMIRAKEEGRLRPGIPGFVEPVRRVAAPRDTGGRTARRDRFRFEDPSAEPGELRMFYDSYVQAAGRAGEAGGGGVSYEKFLRQILAKTEAIKKKSGCDAVTYSIEVGENGVSLKARPARQGRGGKENG